MRIEQMSNMELIRSARQHGSGPGIDELCKRLEAATRELGLVRAELGYVDKLCGKCWLANNDPRCICE